MRPWGGEMPPQSSPGGKNMAIQLNDNALTTLEAVKTFIGIPEDDVDEARDNTLIQLINAASAWLETQLGRKLGLHTYIQKCAGPGTQRLVLEHYPIISIEQIKSLTTGEIINGYDFDQDGEIGVVYREDGWTYQGHIGGLSRDYIAPRRTLRSNMTPDMFCRKTERRRTPAHSRLTLRQLFGTWSHSRKLSSRMMPPAFLPSPFPTFLGRSIRI